MRVAPLLLALSLALVTACAEDEPPPQGQEDPGAAMDSPDEDTDEPAEVPDVPVDLAIVEAGGEFDADPDSIEVVSAEEVTWPDGALGCPEPDGMYTQALVEGYRIVLDVDGQEVHYHGARGEPPFYCADPQDPAETGETVDR